MHAAYEGFFSNRVEAIYHHFKIEIKQAMIDTLQEEINVLKCLCDEILATIFYWFRKTLNQIW